MVTRREFIRRLGMISVGTVVGIPALGEVEKVIGVAGDYAPTPSPEQCKLTGSVWFRTVYDGQTGTKQYFISDDGYNWNEQIDAPLTLEVQDESRSLDIQCCLEIEDWENIGEDIEIISARNRYRLYLQGDEGFSSAALVNEIKEFNSNGDLILHFEPVEPDPTEIECTWKEF